MLTEEQAASLVQDQAAMAADLEHLRSDIARIQQALGSFSLVCQETINDLMANAEGITPEDIAARMLAAIRVVAAAGSVFAGLNGHQIVL